ncbi:hypothetical protein QL093DRAFT_1386505 [Fusarium oxysporum]|nr:hypothetical protein QL093DRAFT_1386505 [Fusarium oxysporum]
MPGWPLFASTGQHSSSSFDRHRDSWVYRCFSFPPLSTFSFGLSLTFFFSSFLYIKVLSFLFWCQSHSFPLTPFLNILFCI